MVFLKGFFADTLPTAPISKLALLRLDGDLYASTRDALVRIILDHRTHTPNGPIDQRHDGMCLSFAPPPPAHQVHAYHKLSPGGYVIVDDYHSFAECRRAVDEFRAENQIDAPLVQVDDACVYWRVSAAKAPVARRARSPARSPARTPGSRRARSPRRA